MSWKALLNEHSDGDEVVTVAALDEWAAAARGRLRARVDAIRTLERVHHTPPPAPPALSTVLAAAVGPGSVREELRRWREARSTKAAGALALLERRVEATQREVSALGLHIDALAREEQGIHAEIADFRSQSQAVLLAAERTAERAASLRTGLRDLARVRLRARSGRDVADDTHLDADQPVLEARLRAADAQHQRLRDAAERLGALVERSVELLGWCATLREGLEHAHRQGTDVLHDLDHDLTRLAAEAQGADLGAALAESMDALRASVGRVHRAHHADGERLLARLDHLVGSPDLLARPDPIRDAADAEVERAVALARRT